MLDRLLGWSGFNGTAVPHANPLSRCLHGGAPPAEDRPTDRQRDEVRAMLYHDIALYEELEARFDDRFRAMFPTATVGR